ncbi:MAG: GFA family protein [Rhodospirillales bacterium]|nr:GFA family protein [Rhodospirillales bacterium]
MAAAQGWQLLVGGLLCLPMFHGIVWLAGQVDEIVVKRVGPAVLTGGFQCGAVRQEIYRKPVNPHVCHCRMCQKAMGGPIAAYAAVKACGFAWTHGEPKLFKSSSIMTPGFCSDCGTPLWFRFDGDSWIGFTLWVPRRARSRVARARLRR